MTWLAVVMVGPVLTRTTAVGADAPAAGKPARIVVNEGVWAETPGRVRRSPVARDPIIDRVLAGRRSMPRAGESVGSEGGGAPSWRAIKASPDGAFPIGSRGGYLAVEVSRPRDQVLVLEASGHSTVHVNGEPRTGDPYALGHLRLPVRLHAGSNTLLFQVDREPTIRVAVVEPRAQAELNPADMTVPDLVVGEPVETLAAVVVLNVEDVMRDDLILGSQLPGGPEVETAVPALLPCAGRKVGFRIHGPAPAGSGRVSLSLALRRRRSAASSPARQLDTATIALRSVNLDQVRRKTFRSAIDGSVQYYAIVPALRDASTRPGLVLTLHGAGVEAMGQAESYAAKPGLHIVAPTNRRPYSGSRSGCAQSSMSEPTEDILVSDLA